jgi:hypothetical protein
MSSLDAVSGIPRGAGGAVKALISWKASWKPFWTPYWNPFWNPFWNPSWKPFWILRWKSLPDFIESKPLAAVLAGAITAVNCYVAGIDDWRLPALSSLVALTYFLLFDEAAQT